MKPISLASLSAILVAALCYPQLAYGCIELPEPPEGWENAVIPGFTPSIESAIQRYPPPDKEECEKLFAGWGSKAVKALIALYQDERWVEFRRSAQILLAFSNSREAETFLVERFHTLAEMDELAPQAETEFHSLCLRFGESGSESLLDVLVEYARHGDQRHKSRYWQGLYRNGTARALQVLKEIQTQEQTPKLQWRIDSLEGTLRAQRPMSEILAKEREREGGPK
jgi:hypothetical protein